MYTYIWYIVILVTWFEIVNDEFWIKIRTKSVIRIKRRTSSYRWYRYIYSSSIFYTAEISFKYFTRYLVTIAFANITQTYHSLSIQKLLSSTIASPCIIFIPRCIFQLTLKNLAAQWITSRIIACVFPSFLIQPMKVSAFYSFLIY